MDFSRPRQAGEAIARVLWDADVRDWWSVTEGKAAFAPTHRVQILVPDEHNRKVAKAVDAFKKDFEQEDFADHFRGYLSSSTDYNIDWATIFVFGPLLAYLMEKSAIRDERRGELDRLFSQMAGYITVSPQGV